MIILGLMSVFIDSYSVLVMQLFERVDNIISVSIAIFSVLLLVLSVSGYRKTRIRLTIYAIIIFALFATQQFLDYADDIFAILDSPITDVVIHSLTLIILVIFFLAIVKRPTK